MTREKLNPRIDIVFKKTFGVDENKDLLISLINSIVNQEDQVKDLTLKNPYNSQNFKDDKLSILDIKAQGMNGKIFNIEMQVTDEANYDKRALYYWAKAYTDQVGSSQAYSKLEKTLGIHILNFLSIPESPKYHNIFKIKETELNLEKFDGLELHTIELSKFDKEGESDLREILENIKTKLDKWATFFTHPEILLEENLPKVLDDLDLKKAAHIIDVMHFSKEEREVYESRLNWFRREEDALVKRFEDGMAEGIEKGIAEGIEKGKEEGKKEEKFEMAKKMLTKNKSIEEIMEYTELSKLEIEELRTKLTI